MLEMRGGAEGPIDSKPVPAVSLQAVRGEAKDGVKQAIKTTFVLCFPLSSPVVSKSRFRPEGLSNPWKSHLFMLPKVPNVPK